MASRRASRRLRTSELGDEKTEDVYCAGGSAGLTKTELNGTAESGRDQRRHLVLYQYDLALGVEGVSDDRQRIYNACEEFVWSGFVDTRSGLCSGTSWHQDSVENRVAARGDAGHGST